MVIALMVGGTALDATFRRSYLPRSSGIEQGRCIFEKDNERNKLFGESTEVHSSRTVRKGCYQANR